ncbi:hypothetical protein BpHYR1_045957 [Brachionus plicatilis]|uniref:Uncharacterized protein n=1 Tax=Brachionus plicatilis TaxID=10195 RepID=A0A3M7T6K9_BRAPC|nr:hypothetical protein BpHYR1_045957 [Brachionus plicatilis]
MIIIWAVQIMNPISSKQLSNKSICRTNTYVAEATVVGVDFPRKRERPKKSTTQCKIIKLVTTFITDEVKKIKHTLGVSVQKTFELSCPKKSILG